MAGSRNLLRAKALIAAWLFVAGLAMTACNGGASMTARDEPANPGTTEAEGFARFPDLPIPRGAAMNLARTLVLGSRDDWIGRLAMTVSGDTTKLYDFFDREMPRFGWAEITSVRSGTSLLTFGRGDRVATVAISQRTISGVIVDVTISPRERYSGSRSAMDTAASPATPRTTPPAPSR